MRATHGHQRRTGPERVVLWMLVTAMAMTGLLAYQAYRAVELRRDAAEMTLHDVAAFSAEVYAGALDSSFQTSFLNALSMGPAAAEELQRRDAEFAGSILNDRSVPMSFDLDLATETITTYGSSGAVLSEWVLESVLPHARDIYHPRAPYAVLAAAPAGVSSAIVYRLESGGAGAGAGERRARGFVFDLTALQAHYASVVDRTRLLPTRPDRDPLSGDDLRVTLAAADGALLFESRRAEASDIAGPTVIAGKAARIAVTVAVAPLDVPALVPGGIPTDEVPILLGLLVVGGVMILSTFVLMRRDRQLIGMREDFLSNISHEMRTPLAQIHMFVETLLLNRAPVEEDREASLRIIDREATRLSQMVENVLSLSRAAAPVAPMKLDTDLPELLSGVADSFAPMAEARGVAIAADFEGRPCAEIDAGALRRVLINLVDNALKYGPDGQTISIAMMSGETELVVQVDDQGPGIPALDRKRIWDRWARLKGGASPEGTGLGLAVVAGLVEALGGEVEVEDSPEGGARFTCRIPVGRCGGMP